MVYENSAIGSVPQNKVVVCRFAFVGPYELSRYSIFLEFNETVTTIFVIAYICHKGRVEGEARSRYSGVGCIARINGERSHDVLARALAAETTSRYDFLGSYVDDLPSVLNLDAVREAGVRIGADPLGGASVDYWGEIAERHRLDLTVINPLVDATWRFMTLDWDGKIRMDCSSPSAMASLIANKDAFQISTGNDADSDRHGIVTPDGGLMNPNHFLAVAIEYLFANRPQWGADVAIGKTLVSSSMIDRVAAALGRTLLEVPVGFKWFVPGLLDGSVAFGVFPFAKGQAGVATDSGV